LGQAAASRIVGYHPAVLSNGVVRYLKLQDDGRICIYGPAPMQARQAGSWQLSLLVDREQLPGGATRAPGEKRFVVGRTIVDWLWVSSDQSGTMSFSEKGMSYWVLVGRKGGTEPRAESLARQAVNVVLAGTQ
jgi:hypothetical protein